jgi:SEC-C motif
MNRQPPREVIQQLKKEVGFGCPIEGCGSPYLTWHHFDPSYSVKAHHRPEGMIALCREHHDKADAGAFTVEQLRTYKRIDPNRPDVAGRFDWMRNDLVVRVGSSYFFDMLTIIVIMNRPVIWFSRDERGHLLANVTALLSTGEFVPIMVDNSWVIRGRPVDVACPPSGRELDIRFPAGDRVKIEYTDVLSDEHARGLFPNDWPEERMQNFPVVVCEIEYRTASAGIDLSTRGIHIGENVAFRHSTFESCGSISINIADPPVRMIQTLGNTALDAPCPCRSGKSLRKCHARGPGATASRERGFRK